VSEKTGIVVVDDDERLLCEMRNCLTEAGYEVFAVPVSTDAVAAIEAKLPALVVCDEAMPKMDGYEVLKLVRSIPETRAIPFLMLTLERPRPLWDRDDNKLSKPFSPAELAGAVRRILASAASW